MTTSGAPTGLRRVVEEALSIGALSLAALAVLLLVRRALPPSDPLADPVVEPEAAVEAYEAQVEGATTLVLPEDLLAWAVLPPPEALLETPRRVVREVALAYVQPTFRPKLRIESAVLALSDEAGGCGLRARVRVENARGNPMRAALKVVSTSKGEAVLSHRVTLEPGTRSLGLERRLDGACPAADDLRATLTEVRASR